MLLAGNFGQVLFGVVIWAASITSVFCGACVSSLSARLVVELLGLIVLLFMHSCF